MSTRELQQVIQSRPVSDGAGVRIKRSLGQTPDHRFDPFLMLDEFGSDSADDYLAGFPDHPHRGFETVTYMIEGHMLHQDHLGNRGDLRSGDVQWMTAGRGIIHSEMPQQEEGRMRGFQLWLNLPAAEKMQPPAYRDIKAADIPHVNIGEGGETIVIAGGFHHQGEVIEGPIMQPATEPVYFDITLPTGQQLTQSIPAEHHALVYVFEGRVSIGEKYRELTSGRAGLLSEGDSVLITASNEGARFLLLAAKPLREPIAQWGPFVMNSSDEIEQALQDYRHGRLVG